MILSRNSFVLVFVGGIPQLSRDMLQNGVSRRCAGVRLSTKGGGVAPFWGSANLPEKVSRDMGYRSDSIPISRDMGPLVARAIRNVIRANRVARIIGNLNPCFYSASGRFARITRISDSRESPDSRESCESIRANHATKMGPLSSPECSQKSGCSQECSRECSRE